MADLEDIVKAFSLHKHYGHNAAVLSSVTPFLKENLNPTMKDTKVDHTKTNIVKFHQQFRIYEKPLMSSKINHSLLPKVLNAEQSRQALDIVKNVYLFNKLVHLVSLDQDFLNECFRDLLSIDPFTKRLFEIYLKNCKSEAHGNELDGEKNNKRRVFAGANRYDLMFDQEVNRFLQVELNTISCSFAGASEAVFEFHRELIKKFFKIDDNIYFMKNGSLKDLCLFLKLAIDTYVTEHNLDRNNNKEKKCIMVIKKGEPDLYDHNLIIDEIHKLYKDIEIKKLTLEQVHKECAINPRDNGLYHKDKLIHLVYFRAGYDPTDYPTEKEWNAREKIEQSNCVAIPTVGYQLAGTKKVQQMLSIDKNLSRFMNDENCETLKRYFTEQYGFTKADRNSGILERAASEPDSWLLKPQREGGGHIINGRKLKAMIQNKSNECLGQYVLMKKINADKSKSLFVNTKDINKPLYRVCESVSEFGFYGYSIYPENEMNKCKLNEKGGLLLRTKPADAAEGGVMAGEGVLDSFVLSK